MPRKSKAKPVPPPEPKFPRTYETYGDPRYAIERHYRPEPTAFNGIIEIRRYRITVELIDEPVEVLRERLKKLWRETERSMHRWDPMRAEALKLGMPKDDLPYDEQGVDYKGRQW